MCVQDEVEILKSKAADPKATPDDDSDRKSAGNELWPCIDFGKAA